MRRLLLHASDGREVEIVDLRVGYLVKLLLAGVLNQVNLLLQLVEPCLRWLLGRREGVRQLGLSLSFLRDS